MFPTTQTKITDLSIALAQSKVHQTTTNAGKAFIRFDFKTGDFTFGRDQEEITGDEIVVNTQSFTHGWVLWVNGSPQKVMRSFVEQLPEPMPAVGEEQPSEARGFEARFEDDEETLLVFESNSYGGRKGADALLHEVMLKSQGGEDDFLYPVVKLTSESYKAKQGGTIHNPLFKVVDWVDSEGNRESANGTKKLAAKDEPEESVQAEEAPRRRRRSA